MPSNPPPYYESGRRTDRHRYPHPPTGSFPPQPRHSGLRVGPNSQPYCPPDCIPTRHFTGDPNSAPVYSYRPTSSHAPPAQSYRVRPSHPSSYTPAPQPYRDSAPPASPPTHHRHSRHIPAPEVKIVRATTHPSGPYHHHHHPGAEDYPGHGPEYYPAPGYPPPPHPSIPPPPLPYHQPSRVAYEASHPQRTHQRIPTHHPPPHPFSAPPEQRHSTRRRRSKEPASPQQQYELSDCAICDKDPAWAVGCVCGMTAKERIERECVEWGIQVPGARGEGKGVVGL